MYLYQDLNRRPSTIDGYRTAIVDTLGPSGQHIAHNADLHRLLSSFHRDRPKSSRNLPKWNLSVVLNELTKAPIEPMKDTDLKHLTLKTAFLLALASGKRRSEIHAWVANKVSNLGQWEKVTLFPSSDFIVKNQLAREGSQSVSPVTIPALTTIVDRQFKEDRTLCPVRALRYYLDRTKDLRGALFYIYLNSKFLGFRKFQRESRTIGQKLSRDDNYQHIRWLTRTVGRGCGNPRTALSPTW